MIKSNLWTLFLLTVMTWGSLGAAQDCPTFSLDGTWKTEKASFFFRRDKTYRISQAGCYVLIYDLARKATWRVDLSGARKIKVPPEMVKANLDGSGPIAARNMQNLEITLEPRSASFDMFSGRLKSEMQLDAHARFPLGLRIAAEAELYVFNPNSPCSLCGSEPPRITVYLQRAELLDITEGMPHGMDKASFLAGVNLVFSTFLNANPFRMEVLSLVKDQ